jgi:MoaA/NifB/PqqE/SkfB family radical SAM enzyme
MSYCNAPWKRKFIEASGDEFPCCQFDRTLQYDIKKVKHQMARSEEVPGCHKCYTQEKGGERSLRQYYNSLYGEIYDENITDVEIALDNICNLKCLTCFSRASHNIYEREKKLFGTTATPKKLLQNKNYLDIDWSNVCNLHLYGGEPFYSASLIDFLAHIQSIVNLGNLHVSASTNGTVIPDVKVLSFLKKTRSVYLNLSIDAYGELNNFIRDGCLWQDIEENMHEWYDITCSYPHIKICVFSTISIYNANQYHILKKFIKKNFPKFEINFQNLQYPEWQCIANTPQKYKDILLKNRHVEDKILNFLKLQNKDYFQEFVNYTNITKGVEPLRELNPQLYSLIQEYTLQDYTNFFRNKINEYKN